MYAGMPMARTTSSTAADVPHKPVPTGSTDTGTVG